MIVHSYHVTQKLGLNICMSLLIFNFYSETWISDFWIFSKLDLCDRSTEVLVGRDDLVPFAIIQKEKTIQTPTHQPFCI